MKEFYLVLSELIEALIAKGVFQKPELIAILSEVERRIGADSSRPAEVRAPMSKRRNSRRDFLKSALGAASEGGKPSFADVVSLIKETRRPQDASSVSP